MRLNGNDLVSLGLCFGVAGALILAKGYIFTTPVSIKDESVRCSPKTGQGHKVVI